MSEMTALDTAYLDMELLNTLFDTVTDYIDGDDFIKNKIDGYLKQHPEYINVQYAYLEPTSYHNTICHLAIIQEYNKLSIHLIQNYHQHINYTIKDKEGKTILILATKTLQSNVVKEMVEKGGTSFLSSINMVDNDGKTALHYAYMFGLKLVIQLLHATTTNSVNIEIIDNNGKKPIDLLYCTEKEMIYCLDHVSIDYRRNQYAPSNGYHYITKCHAVFGLLPKNFKKENLITSRFDAKGKHIEEEKWKKSKERNPVLMCLDNIKRIQQEFKTELEEYYLNTSNTIEGVETRKNKMNVVFVLMQKNNSDSVLVHCLKNKDAIIKELKKTSASSETQTTTALETTEKLATTLAATKL